MIEAWQWQDERAQRQQIAQAWRTAALTRTKKLPTLKQLLGPGSAKPLKGSELEKRRREFAEMSAAVDLSKIGQRKQEK